MKCVAQAPVCSGDGTVWCFTGVNMHPLGASRGEEHQHLSLPIIIILMSPLAASKGNIGCHPIRAVYVRLCLPAIMQVSSSIPVVCVTSCCPFTTDAF